MTTIASATELDALLAGILQHFRRVTVANMPTFADAVCDALGFHCCPREAKPLLHQVGVRFDYRDPQPGAAAWWSLEDGVYTIHTSNLLPQDELNVAAWHEFFEILYASEAFPSRYHATLQERLATTFAVHVLMPIAEVRRQCTELGHPAVDRTGTLMARFGVPYAVMQARLRQLSLTSRCARRRVGDFPATA